MHPELNKSQQRRLWHRADRGFAPAPRWGAVTMRLATNSDKPALERLAELEETRALQEPVLLGVVMQYPVAAISLANGHVVADPSTDTRELLELMKLRARQLQRTA
jgi:hypothetical protein